MARKNKKDMKKENTTKKSTNKKSKQPKIVLNTKKRKQLLLNCVAPKVCPLNHLIYPLNKVTRSKVFNHTEKMAYAELYTLFNTSNLIQFDKEAMAKTLNPIEPRLKGQITSAINKFIKLNLLEKIPVYNPKDKKRKTPIGYVLKDTGLTTGNVAKKQIQKQIDKAKADKEAKKTKYATYHAIGNRVFKYLNQKIHKHYRCTGKNFSRIRILLQRNYTEHDFKVVIDNKIRDWWNNSKMVKYLRPQTLFKPDNFDKYLNEAQPSDIMQHQTLQDKKAMKRKELAKKEGEELRREFF